MLVFICIYLEITVVLNNQNIQDARLLPGCFHSKGIRRNCCVFFIGTEKPRNSVEKKAIFRLYYDFIRILQQIRHFSRFDFYLKKPYFRSNKAL